MKTQFTVAVSILAGIAIGGLAVQHLHAQAKPPAYVIAEIEVSKADAFVKEYAPFAGKALRDSGAKTLVLGGKTVSFDGAPPQPLITINAFESMEKAQAAFTSTAYRDARKIGDKYARFRIFAVEGRSN
jgi:uncharacterized protein (DUF1330 family)